MWEYSESVLKTLPFVVFSNNEGKTFCIPRERILHIETYAGKDGKLNHDKTCVNFLSPNPNSKGALHTIVDMTVIDFVEKILKPAYF